MLCVREAFPKCSDCFVLGVLSPTSKDVFLSWFIYQFSNFLLACIANMSDLCPRRWRVPEAGVSLVRVSLALVCHRC